MKRDIEEIKNIIEKRETTDNYELLNVYLLVTKRIVRMTEEDMQLFFDDENIWFDDFGEFLDISLEVESQLNGLREDLVIAYLGMLKSGKKMINEERAVHLDNVCFHILPLILGDFDDIHSIVANVGAIKERNIPTIKNSRFLWSLTTVEEENGDKQ